MLGIMTIKKEDLDTPEKREKFTVCVVGCGRMGLPHACLFAEANFKVIGVDTDPSILNVIKKGKAPFIEAGMDVLLKKHVKDGRLTVTNNAEKAASESDVIMLVVQTPIDEKKKPDYSFVERACKNVGMGLHSGSLFISASTVGPGVTESIVKETLEKASGLKAGVDFGLAYSPIRATAGRVLFNVANLPRVVGAINEASLKVATLVLNTIVKAGTVEVRNIKTAEAVKLFQNVQRDVGLALANEFGLFCEKAGIDYLEVQKAANTDPYCHLLVPGIVSGHIPKDPYLLIEEGENLGVKLKMTLLTREINDGMVNHAVRLVKEALQACGKTLRRAKVAVLGVSYRPNVKEPRGSLTKELVQLLAARGVVVRVFDPYFSQKELVELGYPAETTLSKAIEGTDCIVVVVGHERFKKLNLRRARFLAKKPAAIVDLGHVFDPVKVEKEGFVYRELGRGIWSK
jgi:UDP-N-acetyl-D-mannosaminuronic acid dehydrogenase